MPRLAFDLNSDYSAFNSYLKRYPDTKRGDKIYSYMAMACLYGRDYAGAVAAYDNIDYFDADMKSNYMKANYMRANQAISDGSYRAAVPYLKAAAYYSDRKSMFNQVSATGWRKPTTGTTAFRMLWPNILNSTTFPPCTDGLNPPSYPSISPTAITRPKTGLRRTNGSGNISPVTA